MKCEGCGKEARVTRTWHENGKKVEVCDHADCGDLSTPWTPDVYFRKPEMVENLADEAHPGGQVVESKQHKARLMREQGVREDGDRYHGSREKGVAPKRFKLKPDFEKKLDFTIKKHINIMKRRP